MGRRGSRRGSRSSYRAVREHPDDGRCNSLGGAAHEGDACHYIIPICCTAGGGLPGRSRRDVHHGDAREGVSVAEALYGLQQSPHMSLDGVSFLLGMAIRRLPDGYIQLLQEKYLGEVLNKFYDEHPNSAHSAPSSLEKSHRDAQQDPGGKAAREEV